MERPTVNAVEDYLLEKKVTPENASKTLAMMQKTQLRRVMPA